MLTDYKFWYIRRDDDGFIEECAIRFYEGEVNTRNQKNYNKEGFPLEPITRYRRSKRLKKSDLPHFNGNKTKKDKSGKDTIIFSKDDFGTIKSDDELRVFLNGEIQKDTARETVPIQKETDLEKLKLMKIK